MSLALLAVLVLPLAVLAVALLGVFVGKAIALGADYRDGR